MIARRRLGLAAIVMLVTAILSTLGFIAVATQQSAVGQQVQATAESDAVLTSSALRLQMDDLRNLVHTYALKSELISAMGDGTLATHDVGAIGMQLANLAAGRSGILFAWVTLPNGLLTQDAPLDASILNRNFACRDWYRGAMQSSSPYLSEAYVSADVGNKLVVAASNRIVNASGATVGVLAFSYLLSATNDTIHQYEAQLAVSGAPLAVWVTDQHGTVVSQPGSSPINHLIRVGSQARADTCTVNSSIPPDTRLASVNAPMAGALEAGLQGRSGATSFGLSSTEVIGWNRDPSLSWVVGVSVPTAAQAGNVINLTRVVIIAAAVALAVVVLIVMRLGATLRRVDQQRVEVDRLSRIDPLTGAYNRRHMGISAAAMISTATRSQSALGLLMLDVDHFKRINDVHGHGVGDAVLQEIVRRLLARLRAGDVLGRWGGEEFVILLPNTGLDEAVIAADAVRQAISASPIEIDGDSIDVTVSIGCASTVDGGAEALLGAADVALYSAKDAGRDCVRPLVPAVIPQAVTTPT